MERCKSVTSLYLEGEKQWNFLKGKTKREMFALSNAMLTADILIPF